MSSQAPRHFQKRLWRELSCTSILAGTCKKLFGGNFFKKHKAGTFKNKIWQEHFGRNILAGNLIISKTLQNVPFEKGKMVRIYPRNKTACLLTHHKDCTFHNLSLVTRAICMSHYICFIHSCNPPKQVSVGVPH